MLQDGFKPLESCDALCIVLAGPEPRLTPASLRRPITAYYGSYSQYADRTRKTQLHPVQPPPTRHDGTAQLKLYLRVFCLSSFLLFFPTPAWRETHFPPCTPSLPFSSSTPYLSFLLPLSISGEHGVWSDTLSIDSFVSARCTRPPVESNPLLDLDDPPSARRLLTQTATLSSLVSRGALLIPGPPDEIPS